VDETADSRVGDAMLADPGAWASTSTLGERGQRASSQSLASSFYVYPYPAALAEAVADVVCLRRRKKLGTWWK